MWPTHHLHRAAAPASPIDAIARRDPSSVSVPMRTTWYGGSSRPPKSTRLGACSSMSQTPLPPVLQITTPAASVPDAGATTSVGPRMRPLTNTERARNFRLRERAHENSLVAQIKTLRKQIAQLENSRGLLQQRSLMTRTCNGGSLEKIARELYVVFRFGLESVDPTMLGPRGDESVIQHIRFKENFMRRIVDQDVLYGDVIVGVDSIIDQWHKHTLSYSKFEIEVDRVEPIAGSETNPIVVVHSKLHARFSRGTLPIMFPSALDERPDLVAKFVDQDITFDCVSRFTFSERDQITDYLVEVNFVEALVKTLGSAQDVAELMELSVITPHTTLQEVKRAQSRSLGYDSYRDDHHHLGMRSYVKESGMRRDEWREFEYEDEAWQAGPQQLRCPQPCDKHEGMAAFGIWHWS